MRQFCDRPKTAIPHHKNNGSYNKMPAIGFTHWEIGKLLDDRKVLKAKAWKVSLVNRLSYGLKTMLPTKWEYLREICGRLRVLLVFL